MARSALSAPCHVVLQRNPTGITLVAPDSCPSLGYGGAGLQDHRMQWNKFNNFAVNSASPACSVVGWVSDGLIATCDQVPATATTTAIAALANVTSGTPMTLVSSSGAGITVLSAAYTTLPFFNVIPSGSLAIGGNATYLRVGIRDITAFYDPTTALTRAVNITGVSGGSGGNFLVTGNDYYGQPMNELITVGAGVATGNGKKAFKWIRSVTPQFTDAHNYSVGLQDLFGFNLGSDFFAYTDTYFNNALVANPGYVAADATTPATQTTGDVRGTVGPTGITSDGTKRLQLFVAPSTARLCTQPPITVGLFGVVPV